VLLLSNHRTHVLLFIRDLTRPTDLPPVVTLVRVFTTSVAMHLFS